MICNDSTHKIRILCTEHDPLTNITGTDVVGEEQIISFNYSMPVNDIGSFAMDFLSGTDFLPTPSDFGDPFSFLVVELWGNHDKALRHFVGIAERTDATHTALPLGCTAKQNPCYRNAQRDLALGGVHTNDIFSTRSIRYPTGSPQADKSNVDLSKLMYEYIEENLGLTAQAPPRYTDGYYPNIVVNIPAPVIVATPYEGFHASDNLLTVLQNISAYALNDFGIPLRFRSWYPEGDTIPQIKIDVAPYNRDIVLSLNTGNIRVLRKTWDKLNAYNSIVAIADDGTRYEYSGITQTPSQLRRPQRVRELDVDGDDDMTNDQLRQVAISEYAKLANLRTYSVELDRSFFDIADYGSLLDKDPHQIIRLEDCGEIVYVWIINIIGSLSANNETVTLDLAIMPNSYTPA